VLEEAEFGEVVEEELLLLGVLLGVLLFEASGVELLVPVVLLEDVELLPTLEVELCELVLAEFGEVLLLPAFGEVLLLPAFGEVLELLSGVLLVDEEELVPGWVEVVEPALPEMLPAVF
jgi:hypothetical protein